MARMVLTEYYALCDGGVCRDLLTEDEKRRMDDGSAYFMTGVMQRAEEKNANGRVYNKKILDREVKNYQKLVKESRALGELDHPDSHIVELKNASHLVTDIWWEGNDVMGKVLLLNTPAGQILKGLAEAGVKLGISSRGVGSVQEQNGNTMVQDDFQLICFDFVSDPSTSGAFMLSEGADINIVTKSDKINRILNDILRD